MDTDEQQRQRDRADDVERRGRLPQRPDARQQQCQVAQQWHCRIPDPVLDRRPVLAPAAVHAIDGGGGVGREDRASDGDAGRQADVSLSWDAHQRCDPQRRSEVHHDRGDERAQPRQSHRVGVGGKRDHDEC
jgi:hypothetical protein